MGDVLSSTSEAGRTPDFPALGEGVLGMQLGGHWDGP